MPETCRVLWQNKIWIISASGWLLKRNLLRCTETRIQIIIIITIIIIVIIIITIIIIIPDVFIYNIKIYAFNTYC